MDSERFSNIHAEYMKGFAERQESLSHAEFNRLLDTKEISWAFQQRAQAFLTKPALIGSTVAILLYMAVPLFVVGLAFFAHYFLYLFGLVTWKMGMSSGMRHDIKMKTMFDTLASPVLLVVALFLVFRRSGDFSGNVLQSNEAVLFVVCVTFIVTKAFVRIANLIYQYDLLGQARKSEERFQVFKESGILITSLGLMNEPPSTVNPFTKEQT